jgi:hypothetical protein
MSSAVYSSPCAVIISANKSADVVGDYMIRVVTLGPK